MSKKQKYLLLVIVLLAIFFRFYLINEMPGGLFPDEAANGLDINSMQQGDLQPFYERGNGREALFFYMEWASVAVFGKGPWQHHIVSALIGLISVLMCFLVTRKIFSIGLAEENSPEEQKKINNKAITIALLAAFLMAVSTWHIVLSRTAFRAIQIPLFSSLTFYFLISAYQAMTKKTRFWFAFLTGASFALGFYTYIAYRIMVPIVGMVLFWPLLASFKAGELKAHLKKYIIPAVFFLLAFIIVIYPLAKYFYQHPGSFIGRSGQVSVFNPAQYLYNGEQLEGKPSGAVVVQVVAEVAKQSMIGYFTSGDLNWRHNLSGFPFLSPLYSLFFGIGLLISIYFSIRYFFAPLKYKKYWSFFLLTVWFFAMLLPVITTAEGIPHGLRSIGTIPVVFILSGWALYELSQLVMKTHNRLWQDRLPGVNEHQWIKETYFTPGKYRLVSFALKLTAICFFAAIIFQAYFLYFVYAYNSPENFYAFRSDLTPVADYVRNRCDKQHTYLVLDKFSVQTTDYTTSDWQGYFSSPCNVPYRQVDPEDVWKLEGLALPDQIVFTQSSVFDIRKFKQSNPTAQLVYEYRNKFGQTVMAVYEVR